MDKSLLPKGFFQNHKLDRLSAAIIADAALVFKSSDALQQGIEGIVTPDIPEERREKIQRDKAEAQALANGEAVVAYMRQDRDNLADQVFLQRALELERGAVPLILRRYKTTAQDRFVELAFHILNRADLSYTKQLFAEYQEIRDPYAQSRACLLFGERKLEEAVPLLLREYARFQREYPSESFDQEPLLGLYILYGKA